VGLDLGSVKLHDFHAGNLPEGGKFYPMEIALALVSLLGLAALSQGRRWGWAVATLASLGYVWFCWQIKLPGQAFLNLVYAFTQVWGWQSEPVFRSQPRAWRWLLLTPLLALALQQFLASGDAWLTAAALITQILTAAKVRQVWRFWVLIDLATSVLYAQQQYWATAVLYLVFAGVAEAAHRTWQGGQA